MVVKYVGKQQYRNRLAEMSCREDELERFNKVIEELRKRGWDITDGVPCWAACVVYDMVEYSEFVEDWKEAKRISGRD